MNKLQLSFEKVLLLLVFVGVFLSVLLMEKVMPHQSATVLLLFLLVLYSCLISAANFHHRRKLAKGMVTPAPPADYRPTVSVVVPAHNEAAVIEDTIKNLMALDYDDAEIWVLDDRSTDGTADVLAKLAEAFPNRFHYMVRPQTAIPGKSAVLNDALVHTKGEVLVVFDADARVESNFLKRAVPYLADPGVGAVQVRKMIMNREANLLTRCQYYEYLLDAHFQAGRDIIQGAVELRGNGQLVKREALLSVGGWTEETITDDLDLSTKLHIAGWDIRFVSNIVVQEEGILHFKPLLRQRRRWAEGSLKRYLEYSIPMTKSPKVSRRATLDMLAYFIEFIFPLWIGADILVQTANYFIGYAPSHWFSSLVVLPALALFFVSGLFVSIRQYDKAGILHSVVWAVETAVFLLVIWVPVVLWITLKVLLTPDRGPLNWGKTEHLGTQAFVKRSKLDRLKRILQRSGNSLNN